jgi:hypothetical protein
MPASIKTQDKHAQGSHYSALPLTNKVSKNYYNYNLYYYFIDSGTSQENQ